MKKVNEYTEYCEVCGDLLFEVFREEDFPELLIDYECLDCGDESTYRYSIKEKN